MFSFDNSANESTLNARALENVRAMVAWKRSDAGLKHDSADARPIRSVGIVGAGIMGAEIAAAHIKKNLPVTIFDNNPDALTTISARTSAELAAELENADIRNELVQRLLQPAAELAEVAKCDLIIESILEKLPAKQELLSRLQEHITPDTIVVSNTSTIPIGKMAGSIAAPHRFCGLHFFHPVCERPIVEIIRGEKTSAETITALAAHAKVLDKLPLVVADGPGFLVNRLLLPYLIEALELLMEGASIELIDSAAVEFGMAKGPFRLMDEIGLDTTLHSGWSMSSAFPDRIPISPLLVALIKSGRLGQKSGAGFYSYKEEAVKIEEEGDSPIFVAQELGQSPGDPEIIKIVARWVKTTDHHSPEAVVLRLLLPMILEAARILDEGEVSDPRDIDLAAIFGLGFPARRGGLLWWADAVKPAKILEMLSPFEPIGPRMHPTPLLSKLATQGGRFYDSP